MNIQKRRRRTNDEGEIRSAAVENCILPSHNKSLWENQKFENERNVVWSSYLE